MEEFIRIQMLLGSNAIEKLKNSHIAIFGLGGVGSAAAEALVRSGVGELTLVDCDTVGISNINRQLIALHSTVGLPKVEAAAQRLSDINPDLKLHLIFDTYCAENREKFFITQYTYIIDAIDLVSCKLDLIQTSLSRYIPIISALGTGNKLDISALRVSDISKTENCPLARVVRKELRNRGILHHKVVFSPETALVPDIVEAPPPGRRSVPGSVMWVPVAAGLMLAGEAIRDITDSVSTAHTRE